MTFIGYVMNSLTYFLYSTKSSATPPISRHDGVQGGYRLPTSSPSCCSA